MGSAWDGVDAGQTWVSSENVQIFASSLPFAVLENGMRMFGNGTNGIGISRACTIRRFSSRLDTAPAGGPCIFTVTNLTRGTSVTATIRDGYPVESRKSLSADLVCAAGDEIDVPITPTINGASGLGEFALEGDLT